MAKKVYDVKPPRVAKKTSSRTTSRKSQREEKEPIGVAVVHGKRATRYAHSKGEGRFGWLPIFIGVLAVVFVVGVYLFFALPKAKIYIWPKVETLSFQQTILADKSVQSIDIAKAVIPAQYFEASKIGSQDFLATGNASNEGRASGTITVYNKYDPVMPFTLKTGTHFMSDSGKLFIASQKIVIPAAKKSGSKITPGSVQVKIQAVEGGESYNIPPSNFSVPGLKGTAYYYSVYAASTSAMAGGYAGKVKKVTDDDIQEAKDVSVKKVTEDAITELKDQVPSDYILIDDTISSNTNSAATETKAGTVADKFTYKATVKVSALAFKKSDLEQFAKNYIISQVPSGQTLLDSSFKIDYSAGTVDISGGKETLILNFSSGIYKNIDRNSISFLLLGENENQIRETINNTLGDSVSEIETSFWPFWVKAAPNKQKAVSVELKFQ
jgi:hypothetical protein